MISDSNIVLHNTIFINFDLGDLQINRDLPLIICDHISKLGCNPIYQYMKHPETSFLHKIQNFCSNYDLDYRHSNLKINRDLTLIICHHISKYGCNQAWAITLMQCKKKLINISRV